MSIRNVKTASTVVVMIHPEQGGALESHSRLIFVREGNQNYLTQVWTPDTNRYSKLTLRRRHDEELRTQIHPAPSTIESLQNKPKRHSPAECPILRNAQGGVFRPRISLLQVGKGSRITFESALRGNLPIHLPQLATLEIDGRNWRRPECPILSKMKDEETQTPRAVTPLLRRI